IGATLVTAEGQLVHASDAETPELMWALRGGGGGLGVVTQFEYRAVPIGPQVAFNVTFYPQRDAKRVFHAHEAFLQRDPGLVSTLFALGRIPDEGFPEELHGEPFAAVLGMHAGEAEAGLEAMRPLREICEPLADLSDVMPYLDAQRVFDPDYPDGLRYYWKSTSLPDIGDEVLDVLLAFAARAPSDRSTLDVWRHGGRMAEPANEATAYGRRDLTFLVNGEANWERPEDDAANVAWVRDCLKALEPYAADHLYLNFPGFLEEGIALERAAHGDNHARLEALRRRYDPDGVFRGAPAATLTGRTEGT
ncbi:MAG: BBE domain-containing protein, partial [Jiangellaceae bacterium]